MHRHLDITLVELPHILRLSFLFNGFLGAPFRVCHSHLRPAFRRITRYFDTCPFLSDTVFLCQSQLKFDSPPEERHALHLMHEPVFICRTRQKKARFHVI